MRRKLRVLFAAYEAVPFMKTGGLGDVGGSLPQALKEAGCECRVIIPKFMTIPDEYKSKMTHVTDFYVSLGWRNVYCGIEKLTYKGVVYYFVDNEYYFNRERPYGYFDDGERIAYFSKAIVECLQYLPDFKCDVLHCNDWHTALAPVFLREFYQGLPLYENVKTVFSVHNLKFQGQMSDYVLGDILGLWGIPAAANQLRFSGIMHLQGNEIRRLQQLFFDLFLLCAGQRSRAGHPGHSDPVVGETFFLKICQDAVQLPESALFQ